MVERVKQAARPAFIQFDLERDAAMPEELKVSTD
jgi:hypothetical protein